MEGAAHQKLIDQAQQTPKKDTDVTPEALAAMFNEEEMKEVQAPTRTALLLLYL